MNHNLRIKGIVKTANNVKKMLKFGIKASEFANFKQYIQETINKIENICEEANSHPDNLPTRSRNAYYFLKEIDFNNFSFVVPLQSESIPPEKTDKTIGIKNIVKQKQIILNEIFSLAQYGDKNIFNQLFNHINDTVTDIEIICLENQVTPANLSKSSLPIYGWMKFLTNPYFLESQILATRKTIKITNKIKRHNSIEWQDIFVGFTNMKSLCRGKKEHNQYKITINQGFMIAGDTIITAIITNMLTEKNNKNTQLIRQYTHSAQYRDILLQLDLSAEINTDNPQGKCYDLNVLFEQINRRYFANSLSKPRLTWSQYLTTRKFGHYEASRDKVVISLTLDNFNIPSFVAEFVLYHELLHKKCGQRWENGLKRVHTTEFKQLEQQFEFYEEAEEWLNQLTNLG